LHERRGVDRVGDFETARERWLQARDGLLDGCDRVERVGSALQLNAYGHCRMAVVFRLVGVVLGAVTDARYIAQANLGAIGLNTQQNLPELLRRLVAGEAGS